MSHPCISLVIWTIYCYLFAVLIYLFTIICVNRLIWSWACMFVCCVCLWQKIGICWIYDIICSFLLCVVSRLRQELVNICMSLEFLASYYAFFICVLCCQHASNCVKILIEQKHWRKVDKYRCNFFWKILVLLVVGVSNTSRVDTRERDTRLETP